MSVAVYNHYKRLGNPVIDGVEIEKSNILMIGPTGVGKTLLARSVARMLDVPIAIADTTSLTEAGYVGDNVESVVCRLLQAADNDVKKAERGIIFLDEIDKKRSRDKFWCTNARCCWRRCSTSIIKAVGSTEIMVPSGDRKGPNTDLVKFNTKNVLFILGGAFVGLENFLNKKPVLVLAPQ